MIPTVEEQLRSDKAEMFLLANDVLITDPLEKFFSEASEDEEQRALEDIYNGTFSLND